jgi:GT2 family glycosyltransferase
MIIQPIIPVIVASFNAGHTIRDAINSVLSQVYTDFEIVVAMMPDRQYSQDSGCN